MATVERVAGGTAAARLRERLTNRTATIGIMSAVEGLLARAGRPVRRPEPANGGLRLRKPDQPTEAARDGDDEEAASALAPSGHD